jgi:transposase-like protein
MENTERKVYLKKTQKDYSLSFKLQIVDEVEKGELSYKQAQLKYGIQGRSTVLVWLRKHGRLDWTKSTDMKKKSTPNKKIKELEKKLRRLEAEKEILNLAIDIADETMEANIRKKYLPQLQQELKEKTEKDSHSN